MSKKLLSFLLTELAIVRIICQGKIRQDGKEQPCQAVLEVPIPKLLTMFQQKTASCPCCGQDFQVFEKVGTGKDPFAPFASSLLALADLNKKVSIEFVIPDTAT
jgi:endogenous inhibitor of DNA gyrase (YacG/DUF329 family)